MFPKEGLQFGGTALRFARCIEKQSGTYRLFFPNLVLWPVDKGAVQLLSGAAIPIERRRFKVAASLILFIHYLF